MRLQPAPTAMPVGMLAAASLLAGGTRDVVAGAPRWKLRRSDQDEDGFAALSSEQDTDRFAMNPTAVTRTESIQSFLGFQFPEAADMQEVKGFIVRLFGSRLATSVLNV